MRKIMALVALSLIAMMVTPGTAGAKVVEHVKEPVAGMVFEDICGQNLVHTSGNLHVLIAITENDNRASGVFHFQPQGAKLVDESGRTYSGTGIGTFRFNEPFDGNGAANFHSVDSFKIIGHGDAPSLLVQIVSHVTINANGDVTVDFERVSEQCK